MFFLSTFLSFYGNSVDTEKKGGQDILKINPNNESVTLNHKASQSQSLTNTPCHYTGP